MRQKYLQITGGSRLMGEVEISGAKNSAGHLLAASILTNEDCVVHNVPDIVDTEITINILKECGAKVNKLGRHSYLVNASGADKTNVSSSIAGDSRASAIFLGAIVARCGEVVIPQPGGDKIGKRPLDRHISALENLGYKARLEGENYYIKADKLSASEIYFEKNTHMGTDNILLVSCLIPGITVIKNAAEEPEVDDMINFLNNMGAKIRRTKRREITIDGVKKLHGTEHFVIPDRNEATTYGVAALITKGNLYLKNAIPGHIKSFLEIVNKVGSSYKVDKHGVLIVSGKQLKATNIITGAHPAFMTDWQPQIATLLTQANGTSKIIEKIHSNRLGYTKELIKMGAKIVLYNPWVKNECSYYDFDVEEGKNFYHACKIFGQSKLKGTRLTVSDIRAGAALVLAALCAEGISVLTNLGPLERGYEDLIRKLSYAGAIINTYEE